MAKSKSSWRIILLLTTIIIACTQSKKNTYINTSPNYSTNTPNPINLETTAKSSTPTVNVSPSPTVLPTFTQAQKDIYMYNGKEIPVCASGGKPLQPPDGFGVLGTIVYQTSTQQGLFTIGSMPLVRSRFSIEEQQDIYTFGISPDGKWLAFSPVVYDQDNYPIIDKPSIVLISSTGENFESTLDTLIIKNKLWDDGLRLMGFSSSYWINNDLIQTDILVQNPDLGTGTVFIIPEVFDPFRGEWKEDLLGKLPNRYNTGEVGFSPDVSRGLYINSSGIALRDLTKNVELWNDLKFTSPYGMIIQWAPDSSIAMVANLNASSEDRQYFLIDRDGKKQQVIASSTIPYNEFYIYNFRWSPSVFDKLKTDHPG
jgi:hypothetical protein